MKRKEGISAVLVIYNEEKVIERCLKSLVNCVDEIIVIHDGPCDDESISIVKKYTKKIYIGERRGMCELHFIDALKKVNYNWVLRIDADEYLESKLQKNIKNLIKDKTVDCYTFIWKIWNGEKYITKDFPIKKTLFRLSKLFFFEFPHKEFDTTGIIENTKYILEHKPLYNNYTIKKVLSKWKKWCEIHAKYYLKEKVNTFGTSLDQKRQFQSKIKKQVKYSNLLLCPIWFFYSVFKSFFYRGFYKNLKTWKIAFFQGIYGFYLCYFISKEKNK